MSPAGHLAGAWFLSRRALGLEIPVFMGMLVPDLIDKWLLAMRLTPYGRTVGHSVLLWGAMTLLWALASMPRRSAAFLLGGFAHLVIDLGDDVVDGFERSGYAFSAWLGFPITNPDLYEWRVPHLLPREIGHVTSIELATVAFAIVLATRSRMLR
jgi:hypothetical protein